MKTWNDIEGWFNFDDIYNAAIDRASSIERSIFVEVGAWMGRSAAYMATKIKESKKPIDFYVVDTWDGIVEDSTKGKIVYSSYIQRITENSGSIYKVFLKNMEDVGVLDIVHPIKAESLIAANQFLPNSCDFVFIDAHHEYKSVLEDINVWLPKVKKDGIIAGHDYNAGSFPGVIQAVNEKFGKNYRVTKESWVTVIG